MKRVGIYNPYLDILGGGERYILTIARCLSRDFSVDVFWKDPKIVKKAQKKFHLDLSKISVKRWFTSPITRTAQLQAYDVFFYVTDGSLFFSTAKKNFLIIQSPDKIPNTRRFLMKAKLKTWTSVVCYSQFVASIIKNRFSKKITPLFVPIDPSLFKSEKKEKIILSVGRFFPKLHNKKQDVLIDVFRKLSPQLLGWKLVFAGSVDPGGKAYLNKLKDKVKGLSVEFYDDISFSKLVKLYSRAAIYWHGAGFGEDLKQFPERAEHFGVSTVEAMASGCIPIVFAGGGQAEIVTDKKNGFLWRTKEELMRKTTSVIKESKKYQYISKNAIKRVQNYTAHKFCSKLHELVEK